MTNKKIWEAIELAVRADKKTDPNWPDHPAAWAGKVGVKTGDLLKACMNYKYRRNKESAQNNAHINIIQQHAIETAAAAIRFLQNIDK